MKINISCLALVAALAPAAEAWSLYANGKTIARDKELDVPCDRLSLKKGQKISWYEAYFERCTLHVYEDKSCKDWAGTTKETWKDHKLTQSVGSYSVSCAFN